MIRVYLDNNATTKPLPVVVESMLPFLREQYANPSSAHLPGQEARHAVDCAREQTAHLIGAKPNRIVFTSGGTESINLAIRGTLRARAPRTKIVTTSVEHPATMRVTESLQANGYDVSYVAVDRQGRIDHDAWAAAITEDTALVTFLHANNETGVIFDVVKMASIAAGAGVPVHVDAVQTAGKLEIDVSNWPVQLVSLAAHKFHGPKGVGALYVEKRNQLEPMLLGGTQEFSLRGGTENVAGIVGMGCACEAAKREWSHTATQVQALRDDLERRVRTEMSGAHVIGDGAPRVYNTANIAFEGLQAEAMLILLSSAGICASAGAACSSGSLEPSHVLKAMGIENHVAQGAIRFSLSRFNTPEEIDRLMAVLPDFCSRLASLSTP